MARRDSFTNPYYASSSRAELAKQYFTEFSAFTGTDIKAFILPQGDHLARLEMERRLNSLTENSSQYLINNEGVPGDLVEHELVKGQDPGAAAGIADDTLPLVNLQSITISTFRQKSQVRALGHVNARGLARGSRTVAGTFILTEFNRDAFWDVLTAPIRDVNPGDNGPIQADQMRPFDIMLLFAHELGSLAIRHIYGLEIVTNGVVYSIQDYYSENTVSYIAHDVSPLIPLTPAFDGDLIDMTGSRIKLRNLITSVRAETLTTEFEYLRRTRNPFK